MLSSLVNGLGDLGLLFLGVVSTQMLNGLAMLKGWKVLERIAKDTDRDNFMSPEDAVSYGLIDKVMARRGEAA